MCHIKSKKAQHQAQEPAPEGTIAIPPPAVAPALKQRWGQLSKKVYEADPLLCPRCGGAMRTLALIDQPEVIEKILPPHLELWPYAPHAPPSSAVA